MRQTQSVQFSKQIIWLPLRHELKMPKRDSISKASTTLSLSGLNTKHLILLHCDLKGVITELLWNSLYPQLEIKPKQLLLSIVDKDSRSKAMNFLMALQKQNVVEAWEFNMTQGHQTSLVYLSGLKFENEIILVGTSDKKSNSAFLLEFLHKHKGQAPFTHHTIQNSKMLDQLEHSDTAAFDQLTALNNELISTKRQLAIQNAELTRLTEQKNQFLGMAAHDLRNPLSLVLSFSGFLLEEISAHLNEEQLDYLKIIHDQSDFMLDLVNNFLDISTIDAVGLQMNKSAADLKSLISKNIARNQFLFQKKPIFLHLTCPEEIPVMLIDKSKIEQVLNNLLGNAAKFSDPGSNVFLTVTLDSENVTVSVKDHGPGIPLGEKEKLFKAFSQTSVTSTAGESSTGLGLLITKQIINGHDGEIWVESELGKGSTFYFTLPVTKIETPNEQTAESPQTPPTVQLDTNDSRPPLKILVADDSKLNQKVLVQMLSRLGHQTVVAQTGVAVLHLLAKERFDIVFMDVHMPELDGLETTRQIRQQLPLDIQPVIIASTASIALEEMDSCITAGMNDAVSKPVKIENLIDVIERARQIIKTGQGTQTAITNHTIE